MDELFTISEMEMESGLSAAILRHTNFFAFEKSNFEFFGGNFWISLEDHFAVSLSLRHREGGVGGRETTGGGFWDFFTTLFMRIVKKLLAPRSAPGPKSYEEDRRFSALNFNGFEFLMALAIKDRSGFFDFFQKFLKT